MQSVEIDFDVYKALTAMRRDEKDSYNDVLRRELRLPEKKVSIEKQGDNGYWICRGGKIPIGTKLKARYKGRSYFAIVTARGIEYNGKLRRSPSRAAFDITRQNTNGFVFWEGRAPGSNEWQSLSKIRDQANQME